MLGGSQRNIFSENIPLIINVLHILLKKSRPNINFFAFFLQFRKILPYLCTRKIETRTSYRRSLSSECKVLCTLSPRFGCWVLGYGGFLKTLTTNH